jgi:hypothetical protein
MKKQVKWNRWNGNMKRIMVIRSLFNTQAVTVTALSKKKGLEM